MNFESWLRIVCVLGVLSHAGSSYPEGGWAIEEGSLVLNDAAVPGRYALFGAEAWGDYELTLEAKKKSGREGFLIIVRAGDDGRHYFWNIGGWGNQSHGLQMFDGRARGIVGKQTDAKPIRAGQWRKVAVRVEGDRIQGFLDGEKLLDERDGRLKRGRVGVGGWNTAAEFRNIRVAPLDNKTLFEGDRRLLSRDDVLIANYPGPARNMKRSAKMTFNDNAPVYPDVKEATIRIDARTTLHTIDPRIIGSNIEDLNFQLYGGLYSQLIHGESFEEHIDPSDILDLTPAERLRLYVREDEPGRVTLDAFNGRGWQSAKALTADKQQALLEAASGDRQVSRQWRAIENGAAKGAFKFDRATTFNGEQSQRVIFVSGSGEVGVDNAGVNRWGINLIAGKPYEGLLRLRADKARAVHVSLRGADGSVLAEKSIGLEDKSDEYQRVEFALTPAGNDTRGRFAVTLKEPGAITLGYAFLQPGEWGRFEGQPVRKELLQAIVDQGVKVMRYNGSMVNKSPDGQLYKWKEMIGPRDERAPYHGWFNPYASHGFSIFEFIDMCEAAGILAIPGLRIDETAEDMADLVEYALGPVDSEGGRRRAGNGHPAPYAFTHIQIGNEQALDDEYVERFITLGAAVWSKNPGLVLVVSQNLSKNAADWKIGADGAVSPQLKLAAKIVGFGAEQGGAIWWDCHYRGDNPRECDGPNARIACMLNLRDSMARLFPDYDGFKLSPLEENGALRNQQRALGHARNLHTFMRVDDLPAVAVANTLQADGQHLVWNQGRTTFNASRVWFQPPYYVDQIVHRNWATKVVATEYASPRAALDAVARLSDDGKTLYLQVVNLDSEAMEAAIAIDGFAPAGPTARVVELSGELNDENTVDEPTRVAPREREWAHGVADGEATFTFAPRSFTLISFQRRRSQDI